MLHTQLFAIVTTALVVSGLPQARAQGLITQKAISLEMAQAIVQGTIERCRADGFRVSVTVVDGSGLLKAFLRDEGSGPHTIDLSRRKAYTALTFASRWKSSGEAAKRGTRRSVRQCQTLRVQPESLAEYRSDWATMRSARLASAEPSVAIRTRPAQMPVSPKSLTN